MKSKHPQFKKTGITPRTKAGFTLAEVVIAVVIIVVALVPLITVFGEGVRQSKTPRKVVTGTMLAQDLVEEIAAKKFDENPSNPDSPVNLGPDWGESRSGTPPNGNYDDVDDFNGYSDSPPREINGTLMNEYAGFSRAVVVDYVVESNFDAVSAGITRFKRIRVTVTWDGGNGTTELEAIRGNW